MSDFGLIRDHPNSKDILSKLLSGSTPKEVSQWLKLKYPNKNQSHLRLSQKLLKEFTESQYTNYYEQFSEDLITLSKDNSENSKLSATLTHIKPYRERMQEIADMQLQTLVVLEKNIGILLTRFEQMYDLMQSDPNNAKWDYAFIKYFNAFKEGMETLEKLKSNSPDHLAQHNFTVQALQSNVVVLQDAIRETMAELDPEMASLFMDKLYHKLNEIQPSEPLTPQQRLEEAKKFEAQIVDLDPELD